MGSTRKPASDTPAETAPLMVWKMGKIHLSATVNGQACGIAVEPGTTLLEALRDGLSLTGTKKGCDRGECGACTVHVDDRRMLSCMTLAAMQEGKRITTIEGLEQEGNLHPLQAAFIERDGFQCGFCTSGQIMSWRMRRQSSVHACLRRRLYHHPRQSGWGKPQHARPAGPVLHVYRPRARPRGTE